MSGPDNLELELSGVAAELQDPPYKPHWIVVRASVHLPKLPRDYEALVDINDPYIQRYVGAGYLIPIGDEDELEEGP